jgi:hypothetical protein
MKFSVNIKEASAAVYLSVVCRHNLETNICILYAVDYLVHVYCNTHLVTLG